MKSMPCPFCTVEDFGGACCFCDYEGEVTIGNGGMFSTIDQYNNIINANSHQEKMDELHGRNNPNKIQEL